MSTKTIIFAGGFSYPEGYAGTQHVQALADAFRQNGHDVRVLSWGQVKGEKAESSGIHKGIDYCVLPSLFGSRFVQAIAACMNYLKAIRRASHDVTMIVYGPPELKGLHALLIAKFMRIKFVHWVVEDYAAYDLKNAEQGVGKLRIYSYRFFSRIIGVFTDGVIILSKQLERKYQKQGLQTELVPISTGRLFIKPQAKDAIQRNTIVYAGTLGQKDGVEDLIDAFTRITERYPDAKLVLVGSGARKEEMMKTYADRKGVCFVGYLDDDEYEQTLSTAHIVCMTRVNTPYANGGFPYKVGDYLAMARPILATRVSDIELYLEDQKSAMLVDSGNQVQMAAALERLLQDHELADQIGAEGRKVCERFFNPEINSILMQNFLARIAGISDVENDIPCRACKVKQKREG